MEPRSPVLQEDSLPAEPQAKLHDWVIDVHLALSLSLSV